MRNLFIIIVVSLVAVCVLQFMNDMIIRSLALSFSLASLILIILQAQVSDSIKIAHFLTLNAHIDNSVVCFTLFLSNTICF